MDIMDSTDTPTGGMADQPASSVSASSRGALPLTVDQRDDFSSPEVRGSGGSVPTHASDSYGASSSPSAMDRLDASRDNDAVNALPTSTDDVMMPMQEHTTHPSLLSDSDSAASSSASASASASMQHAKDSAKDTAASAKASAKDAAESAKATAKSTAESAKAKAGSVLDKVEDTLHRAEAKVESAYQDVKADVQHALHKDAEEPHHEVRVSHPEPTDKHPDAASWRDAHLHPGMVGLPTHENEVRSDAPTHVTGNQQRGLDAAAAAEPKDSSAAGGGGIMGALSSLHSRLEAGADMIKEKVDGFAEEHLRSSPKEGDHLSSAHAKDFPTLVDSSNEYNTSQIRAKMHPSGFRAGSSATSAVTPETDAQDATEEALLDESV